MVLFIARYIARDDSIVILFPLEKKKIYIFIELILRENISFESRTSLENLFVIALYDIRVLFFFFPPLFLLITR